jgi:ribosome-associated heat shock protein Hsp15
MRIDQFLTKTSLLKQRSAAKILCDQGSVRLNGQYAKPSKQINIGDVIDIEAPTGSKRYRVLLIPSGNIRKGERSTYYEELP